MYACEGPGTVYIFWGGLLQTFSAAFLFVCHFNLAFIYSTNSDEDFKSIWMINNLQIGGRKLYSPRRVGLFRLRVYPFVLLVFYETCYRLKGRGFVPVGVALARQLQLI